MSQNHNEGFCITGLLDCICLISCTAAVRVVLCRIRPMCAYLLSSYGTEGLEIKGELMANSLQRLPFIFDTCNKAKDTWGAAQLSATPTQYCNIFVF